MLSNSTLTSTMQIRNQKPAASEITIRKLASTVERQTNTSASANPVGITLSADSMVEDSGPGRRPSTRMMISSRMRNCWSSASKKNPTAKISQV